jgi:hypothetical protein
MLEIYAARWNAAGAHRAAAQAVTLIMERSHADGEEKCLTEGRRAY